VTYAKTACVVGRAGAMGGARPLRPIPARQRRTDPGSVSAAITRMRPPQLGQTLTSMRKTRASRSALAVTAKDGWCRPTRASSGRKPGFPRPPRPAVPPPGAAASRSGTAAPAGLGLTSPPASPHAARNPATRSTAAPSAPPLPGRSAVAADAARCGRRWLPGPDRG